MLSKAKILVVDDDELLVELMVRILVKNHAEATTAGSLREARALLEKETFDVALIDLHLPDGFGMHLVQLLHESSPATGIIIISGVTDTLTQLAGYDLGADVFLVKPFEVTELRDTVKKVLQQHQKKKSRVSDRINPLSPRHREILTLRAEGQGYDEIARNLFFSISTVKMNLLETHRRLNVTGKTAAGVAAVAKAIRNGWI